VHVMGHGLSDVVCDNKNTPQSNSWSEEGTDYAVQLCPQPQHYPQPCQEDVTPGIELESESEDIGRTKVTEDILCKRC
jgi:hypothetical protein